MGDDRGGAGARADAAFPSDALEVRIFGALHAYRTERGLPTRLEYHVPPDGIPARDVADALELPRELIEGVFCNGHVYPLSHVLRPGDRVGFVPKGIPGPHRFMLGIYNAGRETGD